MSALAQYIPVKDIKVPPRFRHKFVDIDKLAESISVHGQIEPIVVDENLNLIAGERRLKAHQMLKKDTIIVIFRRDLTDLQKKEIELEENIQRDAFTWQEEVAAKNELHKIKQKIHGAAVSGHEKEGSWGIRDTAAALGESVGNTSMDIALARGMKAFPELMKEKSKTVAFKKLKQLQEEILNNELKKRLKTQGIIEHPNIILGDCFDELQKMAPDSVDLIITDPPYGIDIGNSQTFGRSSPQNTYKDGEFETFDMLDKVIKELYRVLKDNRHFYLFFAIDKYEPLVKILSKHGFDYWRIPLIWDKGSGSYPSQSTSYVHSYEPFLQVSKGKRKLNGNPRDVFPIKRVPADSKIHPSEKPTELLRDLIELSSLPGETVLDCFAGSGSTGIAARECNRASILIEKDAVFHQRIVKRFNGEEIEKDDTEDTMEE